MEGIYLTITHGGSPAVSILLSDIDDATDGEAWRASGQKSGPVYVPAGGSIQVAYTSSVARSFESGALRSFINQGILSATLSLGAGALNNTGTIGRFINPDTGSDTDNTGLTAGSPFASFTRAINDIRVANLGGNYSTATITLTGTDGAQGGGYDLVFPDAMSGMPGELILTVTSPPPMDIAATYTIDAGGVLASDPDGEELRMTGAVDDHRGFLVRNRTAPNAIRAIAGRSAGTADTLRKSGRVGSTSSHPQVDPDFAAGNVVDIYKPRFRLQMDMTSPKLWNALVLDNLTLTTTGVTRFDVNMGLTLLTECVLEGFSFDIERLTQTEMLRCWYGPSAANNSFLKGFFRMRGCVFDAGGVGLTALRIIDYADITLQSANVWRDFQDGGDGLEFGSGTQFTVHRPTATSRSQLYLWDTDPITPHQDESSTVGHGQFGAGIQISGTVDNSVSKPVGSPGHYLVVKDGTRVYLTGADTVRDLTDTITLTQSADGGLSDTAADVSKGTFIYGVARFPADFRRSAAALETTTSILIGASPYTPTNDEALTEVDATGGPISVTLPDPTTVPGLKFTVVKIDATANVVTVSSLGAGTINGGSDALGAQYDAGTYQSNGTDYRIVAHT